MVRMRSKHHTNPLNVKQLAWGKGRLEKVLRAQYLTEYCIYILFLRPQRAN